jgi:hypothetical protein
VTETSGATLTLKVSGNYSGSTFNVASDGAGGTNISLSPATTDNWNTPTNGDWGTAADWTGGVPTATTDAVIGGAGTEAITISSTEAAGSLTLANGGATVVETANLSLANALTISAGSINVGGGAGQTISAGSIQNNGVIQTLATLDPRPTSTSSMRLASSTTPAN